MRSGKTISQIVRASCLSVVLASLAGCVHLPPLGSQAQIDSLRIALTSLDSKVIDDEARRVAIMAYNYPRELAKQYRLVRPPLLHNLLINFRLKKRGLCYQWTEDMVAELRRLDLRSLELHWAVAHSGSIREHNTVVISAPHQPFTEGIALDPWRHSGKLFWKTVWADSYSWQEGVLDPLPSGQINRDVTAPDFNAASRK